MNVLCLFQIFDFSSSTIYLDLVNELKDRGHKVMISACTSDPGKDGKKEESKGIECGFVYVPDQFNAGKIKKGLIQLSIGKKLLRGVKMHFWDEKVDIIIYPTPPVTLAGILKPLKSHYGALNYLMLKDIFPQNAVDLKMMREGSILHKVFRSIEGKLYRDSDVIGCMSEGNISYINEHNPSVSGKTELFPNTVKIIEETKDPGKEDNKGPLHFIFGGNLGKPQGIDFLLEMIKEYKNSDKFCFTFIGSGTEEGRVRNFIEREKPDNLMLIDKLPRREYEELLKDADLGIISLSPDFTIPNFPSRLLSYMQLSKPVLAVTDRVTDIRTVIEKEAKCGYWCPSGDKEEFRKTLEKILSERQLLTEYGANGRRYLKECYNVERSVNILERAVSEYERRNI